MYVDLDAIDENVDDSEPRCGSVAHGRQCNRLGVHDLHAHFTVYGYPVAIWDDAGADDDLRDVRSVRTGRVE